MPRIIAFKSTVKLTAKSLWELEFFNYQELKNLGSIRRVLNTTLSIKRENRFENVNVKRTMNDITAVLSLGNLLVDTNTGIIRLKK